ncbi:MAG: hypothetical protein AAF355_02115 [Myxococcota bacterium]
MPTNSRKRVLPDCPARTSENTVEGMNNAAEDWILAETLALPDQGRAEIIKQAIVESARRRAEHSFHGSL